MFASRLKTHILHKQAAPFLKCYLEMAKVGMPVPLPEGTPAIVRAHFKEIIEKLVPKAEDAFLDELTELWGRLCIKGSPQEATFPDQALDLLMSFEVASADISSAISPTYFDEQRLEDALPKSLSVCISGVKVSLKEKSPAHFLRYYMGCSLFDQKVKIPLGTMRQRLPEEWRDVLRLTLKADPSESFLDALSDEWYPLIHKDAVPTTVAAQQTLARLLWRNPPSSKPKKGPIKRGLIERFIHWLVTSEPKR